MRLVNLNEPLRFNIRHQRVVFIMLAAFSLLLNLSKASGESVVQSNTVAEQLCKKISKKLFSVSLTECLARELEPTGSYSVKQQPILLRTYPVQPPHRITPVRVLLVGGIHGDEYSSVSVTFKWMQLLEDNPSQTLHWHIVPLLNPDGLLQKRSQRTNANGVDLNRNFTTPNWHAATKQYWEGKKKCNPRYYPGKAPLSEPESRWLAEEIKTFRPDAIVALHAPYNLIDFDFAGQLRPPSRLGPLHLSLLGTYPGSLGNYAGIQKRIPIITIELASAGRMPKKRTIKGIWQDLNQWLERNLVNPQLAKDAR